MKDINTEFEVVNVFESTSKEEIKEKINKSIRSLCITDIEKIYDLEYDIGVTLPVSASDLKREGAAEQC